MFLLFDLSSIACLFCPTSSLSLHATSNIDLNVKHTRTMRSASIGTCTKYTKHITFIQLCILVSCVYGIKVYSAMFTSASPNRLHNIATTCYNEHEHCSLTVTYRTKIYMYIYIIYVYINDYLCMKSALWHSANSIEIFFFDVLEVWSFSVLCGSMERTNDLFHAVAKVFLACPMHMFASASSSSMSFARCSSRMSSILLLDERFCVWVLGIQLHSCHIAQCMCVRPCPSML